MSSSIAMEKHSGLYLVVTMVRLMFIFHLYLLGGVAEYRSSEGKAVEVPYKGDVEGTVKDTLGGLRSACTYVGAARLRELPRRATFIRCTQQVNNIYSS